MKTWITPILCCLLLIAAGCGKKGDPVPQDKKNLFSWESADAALTGNGCLAISALMKGAARNVDGFSIELEPLAASADSTLPKELADAAGYLRRLPLHPARNAGTDAAQAVPTDSGTRFAFTYCPQTKAAAYRWRLVARNVFQGLPLRADPCEDRSLDQIPRNTLKVSVREPFSQERLPSLPPKTLQKETPLPPSKTFCAYQKPARSFPAQTAFGARPSKKRIVLTIPSYIGKRGKAFIKKDLPRFSLMALKNASARFRRRGNFRLRLWKPSPTEALRKNPIP